MKRVVWLASWYPSRVEPYLGDFVERHAKAASLHHHIHVIYAIKDRRLRWKTENERRRYSPSLTATICYYPAIKIFGRRFEGLAATLCGVFLTLFEFLRYRRRHGKPSCIHVLVSWKAGLPAMLIKALFGVPYFVFERWSIFLEGALPHIDGMKRSEKWLINRIFQGSSGITTTTAYFGDLLQKRYAKPLTLIPNVIVPELFFPATGTLQSPFRFIHASTLDYPKNVDALLAAFAELVRDGRDCELHVYGPNITYNPDSYEHVHFKGEVSHTEIAEAMRGAHALVLFSRYETFGNVIIEAQACGIPVISSDHPVFSETVEPGVNGLKARNGDAADLAQKMREMMDTHSAFNGAAIARAALERYGPQTIGRLFKVFYDGTGPI